MEANETRKHYIFPSLEPPESSYQKRSCDPEPMFLKILNTKRRRSAKFSVVAPALWILLLYFLISPYGNNYALANPVEEDPQNYGSRSNDGLSFSLNSPRKSDRNRDNENRANQKSSSLDNDRKGIKVRLSDEMKQHMLWSFKDHNNDKARIQEAILGFPSDFVITDAPKPIDTKTTEFVTNRAPKKDSKSEDDNDAQPKTKFRHPQQSRGRKNKANFDPNTPRVDNRPNIPNTGHSTSTPNLDHLEKKVHKGKENKKTGDVSREKVDDGQSKQASRGAWTIAWEAHVYFSGTLFVLLAAYCSVNIARLHTFSRLFSRGYFVTLNLFLILMGLLRPIWLFHDPYNSKNTWHRAGAYLLVDTGFPCITTAFAVLFLALLRATQVELISPSFQTPKALGVFCMIHFLVSIGVDITIGFEYNLRYMVLILQGIFIVWSLLLSAGYFYIFSAMNKIAMRQQGDFIRSVYPKLILEGGTSTNSDGAGVGGTMPLSTASLKRPPLARAVHLTLGVAVLGSLLGGVQLFAMIKMLGLQLVDIEKQYSNRPDLNQQQNIWAAYQVSMRVLEVTICTLLAVIATTPLRSDFEGEMDTGMPQRHSMPHPGHPLHQHLQHQHLNGSLPPGSVSPTALGAGLDYETESDNGCSSCCGNGSKTHKSGYSTGSYQMRNGGIDPSRRGKQRPLKSNTGCCSAIFSCFRNNGKSGNCCATCQISCCGFESNPPREFEDEIYSEICSNNHSVRQVMQQQQQQDLLTNNHYSTLGRNSGPGTILALGTLNTSGGELASNGVFQQGGGIPPPLPSGGNHPAIAVGSSSTLMMPYNHKRGAANSQNHTGNPSGFPTQTATLLRSSANYHDVIPASALGMVTEANHASNNPSHSSNANNSATTAIAAGSGSSSRATLESALYSNLRNSGGIGMVNGNGGSGSRPSSMLFNDSGFVRFRMGNDPSSAIMLNNGIQMTTQGGNMISNMVVLDGQAKDINGTIQEGNEALGNTKRAKNRLRDLEGLRASQSFDDSVLLVDTEPSNVSRSSSANNKLSPTDLLQQDHPHFPGDLAASPMAPPRSSGGKGRGGVRSSSRLSHNIVMWNNQLGSNDDLFQTNNAANTNANNGLELERGSNPIYEPPPNSNKPSEINNGDKINLHGASVDERNTDGVSNPADKSGGNKNPGEVGTPSESDETAYGGQSSIYSRAPSQCSSVSATQSFDMRMYGRSRMMQGAAGGKVNADGSNNPLGSGEGTEKKLENPYYYYGSTRNQKNKAKLLPKFQKPKPLLPSQRQALELQTRTGGKSLLAQLTDRPKSRQEQSSQMQHNKPPSRPSSRQALLQQHQQILPDAYQQQQHQVIQQQHSISGVPNESSSSANFARSRSLGGYYKGRDLPQAPLPPQQIPGGYSDEAYQVQMMQQGMPPHMAPQVFQHPGSMTPVTFARWQHDMVNGVYGGNIEGNEFPNARRHNPLYDTPPVSRRTNQSHLLEYNPGMMDGYEHQNPNHFERLPHPHLIGGNTHMGEIRGLLGTPPQNTRMNHQENFARLVNPQDEREHPHFHYQQQPMMAGARPQHMLPLDLPMQPRNPNFPNMMPQNQHQHLPPFSTGMNRLVDPLSPILTDQEMSPMHHEQNQHGRQGRRNQRNSRKSDDHDGRDGSRDEPDYSQDPNRSEEEGRIVTDFLTSDDNLSSRSTSAPVSPSATSDDYHSDENARADRRNGRRGDDGLDDEDDDLVTSQATQGYSEGLADNELDLSEIDQPSAMLDHPDLMGAHGMLPEKMMMNQPVSPLEYSAMLKLYSESGDRGDERDYKNEKAVSRGMNKVPPTNIRSGSENQPANSPGGPWAGTKSTAKDLISRFQNNSNVPLQSSQPGGYHRVSTKDDDIDKSDGELEALGQPASLFSSSSGSESEHEIGKQNESQPVKRQGTNDQGTKVNERAQGLAYRQKASQLPIGNTRDRSPEFRWDGSRIEKQQSNERFSGDNKVAIGNPNLTNGEMADEEISEDQESCFTEDGMEDLYDDESYLDDEEENGLADVETDFDEDKYNEKLDQHLSEMQKHGDLKENASKNNNTESSKNEPKPSESRGQPQSSVSNPKPAPRTVASILSNIKASDTAVESRQNDSQSKISPPGQLKKSNIPRPVTSSNSFSSGNQNGPTTSVSRTASNASASRYSGLSKNTKAFVSKK